MLFGAFWLLYYTKSGWQIATRKKQRPEIRDVVQRVENPFSARWQTVKKLWKPSNSRLSAYMGTVGRELRQKSKSLRSKQNYNKIISYMSF